MDRLSRNISFIVKYYWSGVTVMVSVGDEGYVQHTGEQGLPFSLASRMAVSKYKFLLLIISSLYDCWKECLQVR